jgi:hypothetical protein
MLNKNNNVCSACVKKKEKFQRDDFSYFDWILLCCRGREIVWMFCFRIGLNLWFNGVKWPWIILFMCENKLKVEKDFQGIKTLIV